MLLSALFVFTRNILSNKTASGHLTIVMIIIRNTLRVFLVLKRNCSVGKIMKMRRSNMKEIIWRKGKIYKILTLGLSIVLGMSSVDLTAFAAEY